MPLTPALPCPRLIGAVVVIAVMFACFGARADTPYLLECDGADDDESIQQKILDPDISYILIEGDCSIDETIYITNTRGIRLEGKGRGATILRWDGDDAEAMFSIQNSADLSFGYFSACVFNGHLESIIDMYNACHGAPDGNGGDACNPYDPAAGPGSHGNVFHHIGIGDCEDALGELDNGIRVRLHPGYAGSPTDDCAVAEADCGNGRHFFDTLHVSSFDDSAFVLEGRSSVGNTFTGTYCGGRIPRYGGSGGTDSFTQQNFGDSCVRTGLSGTSDTAGSFSWFGGLADLLSDSVFVLGSGPEAVYVAGLHARQSRMLLRDEDGSPEQTGSVTIESSYFDTSTVHAWEHEDDTPFPFEPSSYGVVVEMHSAGPLSLRNDFFGHDQGFGDCEPSGTFDNISICWSPPEAATEPYGDDSVIGSFVFEGNAIITSNENPFVPTRESYTGEHETMDCLYPSEQRSNLVRSKLEDGTLGWAHMPQHYNELTRVMTEVSASRTTGSRHLFRTCERQQVRRLTDGAAGQRVVLFGPATSRRATVQNGFDLWWWFDPIRRRNLWLPDGLAMRLGYGDTLVVVKGPGEYWFTVGSSDN